MKTVKEIAADCGITDADEIYHFERAVAGSKSYTDLSVLEADFVHVISALYRRIEKLEPCLENCIIMQSRLRAILNVDEVVDALCAEEIFVAADELALREVIKAAGGELVEPI